MAGILKFWKRFRTNFPNGQKLSEETIRGWVSQAWNGATPVQILPVSYGHNRSYRIEIDKHPYRAMLKTYQSLWAHDRQKNESASLKYLAPALKGVVPEIYGEASIEGETPWLLLEWKEGICLADVLGDLHPEERSDVVMQCGELLRKMHALHGSGVGPMRIENGLDIPWSEYFLEQCELLLEKPAVVRTLKRRLMEQVRNFLLGEGPAILKSAKIPEDIFRYIKVRCNIRQQFRQFQIHSS